MYTPESLTTNVEGLSETSDGISEFISSTEVCGFEGCELINNEQLANYLKGTIPPSHFEGCPSIEFDPNHPYFIDSPYTLGFYMCGSHAIYIGDESRFPEGIEGMKDTIIHEIGHNAYYDIVEINPELNKIWQALHSESWQVYHSEGYGFVSSYARTDRFEDFSESYMTYIRDPEKLQFYNPEKYNFLHENVFFGRQYL